ncbi:unnamed protein product [Lampetra fluviatilis]
MEPSTPPSLILPPGVPTKEQQVAFSDAAANVEPSACCPHAVESPAGAADPSWPTSSAAMESRPVRRPALSTAGVAVESTRWRLTGGGGARASRESIGQAQSAAVCTLATSPDSVHSSSAGRQRVTPFGTRHG